MKKSEAFPFPANPSLKVSDTPDRFWVDPDRTHFAVRDVSRGLECWYHPETREPIAFRTAGWDGVFSEPQPFEA
jgi:hypothetical protein